MAHAHGFGSNNAGFGNQNLTFRDRQRLRDLQLRQQFGNQNRQPQRRNFQANTIGGGLANLGTALGDLRRGSQPGGQGFQNLISPDNPQANQAFRSFISRGNTAAQPSSLGAAIGQQGAAPRAPTGATGIGNIIGAQGLQRQPRGLRNNNPGNIEFGRFAQSKGALGTDGRFARFDKPEDGIKAMHSLLKSYQSRNGLKTIRGMIGRWAPANENDVGAYANRVAQAAGVSPDAVVSMSDPATASAIISGMIAVENGSNPFSIADITSAISMDAAPSRIAGGQPETPPNARLQQPQQLQQLQQQAGIGSLIQPQAAPQVSPAAGNIQPPTPAQQPQVGGALGNVTQALPAPVPLPGLAPPGVPPAPAPQLQPPQAQLQPQAAPQAPALPPIDQVESQLQQRAAQLEQGIARFGNQINPTILKQSTDELNNIRKRLSPDGRLKAQRDRQQLQFGEAREGRARASEARDQAVERRAQANQIVKEEQTARDEAKFAQETATFNRRQNTPITERDASGRLFNVQTGENIREVGQQGFFLVDDELEFNEKWINRPENKIFVGAGTAMAQMQSNLINKSAASDSATVIAFAKLLDPTSVVRESEAGRIEAIGSVPDKIKGLITKFNTGQMTDKIRDDIISTSVNIYRAMKTQYDARRGTEVKRAETLEFRPEIAVADNSFVGELPDFTGITYDVRGKRVQPGAAPAQPAPSAQPEQSTLPPQPIPQQGATRVGDNGQVFMFLGGDPNDRNNWFTEGGAQ